MSKFKVNLRQGRAGRLDTSAVAGVSFQRTVHISGPDGVNKEYVDGQVFEESNFYKCYCLPACKPEDAKLQILEDDGREYAPNSKHPVIFTKVINAHSNCLPEYTIDAKRDCHGTIVAAQITNRCATGSGEDINVKFNKSNSAILEIMAGETQTFGKDDFNISNIDFINNTDHNIKMQVLISVVSDFK
jgi:hypothetical protein